MTDRPIIMSAPMVRAILDGYKTQTRRVIVPQDIVEFDAGKFIFVHHPRCKSYYGCACAFKGNLPRDHIGFCKYGRSGDRLWVREPWYPAFKRVNESNGCVYSADDDGFHLNPGWKPHSGWRSPLFMPRWASRLTLEITGIRVERLQKITEEDALSEGVADYRKLQKLAPSEDLAEAQSRLHWPQREFKVLWDSINAKRGYGWSTNPWVLVIEFKRADERSQERDLLITIARTARPKR